MTSVTTWDAVPPAPTADQVLPNRWTALFRRSPRVLSFDIFGFALEPSVLEPDDLHRLVAAHVRDEHGDWHGSSNDGYLAIRKLAEHRAQAAAEIGHEQVIGMPAVREQLMGLLGSERGRAAGPFVASSAIRHEIRLNGELWSANPDAHRLYRAAIAADVAVAFLADSPLPRDLVTRMLQNAGYGQGTVLVSSQEGVTKASGALYGLLASRLGEEPERITHLGPDSVTDGVRAVDAGVRPLPVVDQRRLVIDRVVAGLVDRTGVDAVALALAAERLVDVGATPAAVDVGYYAGGPLATGFTNWTGRIIAETKPDHVVFCGPSGRLLRHVAQILDPALDERPVHELLDVPDGGRDAAAVSALAARLGLRPGDGVLAVGLGWGDEPQRSLAHGLATLGGEVSSACLGMFEPPATSDHVRLWALAGTDDCQLTNVARRGAGQLAALLPFVPDGFFESSNVIERTSPEHEVASGVVRYATDVAPWFAKLPDDSSAALTEPALRLVDAPTAAELELLPPADADCEASF